MLLPQDFEACVEFFPFDKSYVQLLRRGDPVTEQHFVAYFEQLLRIKLRSRMLASDKVEDLRQGDFFLVIVPVRRGGGGRQPRPPPHTLPKKNSSREQNRRTTHPN